MQPNEQTGAMPPSGPQKPMEQPPTGEKQPETKGGAVDNPIFDSIRTIGMMAAAMQEQGDPRASAVGAAMEQLIAALSAKGGGETGNPMGSASGTGNKPMAMGKPTGGGTPMGGGMGKGVPLGGGGMPSNGKGVPVM